MLIQQETYLKERNVEQRGVVIDELKEKYFECETILVIGKCSWTFQIR